MKLRIGITGIALAFATLGIVQAEAQVYKATSTATTIQGTPPVFYTAGYDTITNAGYVVDTIRVTETQASVLFFLNSDKISGNHGGYWRILGSPAIDQPFALIATINIANGDSTYAHVVSGNPYPFYKSVVQDTSATQQSRYKRYFVPRPK